MADSGYDAEVKSIMAFLSMQHPASQPAINPATLDISVEDYVAPRFLRKMRSKVSTIILILTLLSTIEVYLKAEELFQCYFPYCIDLLIKA